VTFIQAYTSEFVEISGQSFTFFGSRHLKDIPVDVTQKGAFRMNI